MKARIKSTGDIFPIAPYAKVTLNVCDDRGTPYEVDFEDIELIPDNISESDTDWSSFRREAAKDIVCAILSSGTEQTDDNDEHFYTFERLAEVSVEWADTLIAKLKEK